MNAIEKAKILAEKIKKLEIQGATNVALSAVKYFATTEFRSREELEEAAKILRNSRPTEPLLFNSLDLILMAEDTKSKAEELLELITALRLRTSENLAAILSKYDVVQTICHSSVVEFALKMVQPKKVVVTETRPRYQGRITAKKLAEFGINVVFGVDSAMLWLMEKESTEAVAIGGDAITKQGVINKIGSRVLAIVAKTRGIPVYAGVPGLKIARKEIAIEERHPSEVWKDAPSAILIHNPAFELVNCELLQEIATELGSHEPKKAYSEILQHYFIRNA